MENQNGLWTFDSRQMVRTQQNRNYTRRWFWSIEARERPPPKSVAEARPLCPSAAPLAAHWPVDDAVRVDSILYPFAAVDYVRGQPSIFKIRY